MPDETVIPAAEQGQEAAPSTEVITATESAPGEPQEPQTEDKPKVTGSFQKRIDKLTREKEFWKEQALTPKQVAQQAAQTETPTVTGKPSENDFETHAEFVEALTDWKVDQKVKSFEAKQNEEKAKTHQKTQEEQLFEAKKAFAAAVPDFAEVMADADFLISPALTSEVNSPEYGPQLAYFLAKNPEEVEKLNDLAPLALSRAIGRLESRFTTAPQKTAAKVTNAPAPPNPVGRSSPTSEKRIEDMTPSEYDVYRAKKYPNLR